MLRGVVSFYDIISIWCENFFTFIFIILSVW
jgi:hypothetical protein